MRPPVRHLRELRLDQRLTLATLSVRTGLSRALLSQIERGRLVATAVEAARIAEGLGFDAGDLRTMPLLVLEVTQ